MVVDRTPVARSSGLGPDQVIRAQFVSGREPAAHLLEAFDIPEEFLDPMPARDSSCTRVRNSVQALVFVNRPRPNKLCSALAGVRWTGGRDAL